MDVATVLAVVAVLSSWGVLLFTMHRWGPGRARRRVFCPKHKVRAKVEVEQLEGEFGRLRVSDAISCSLVPGRRLTCDKECLHQL